VIQEICRRRLQLPCPFLAAAFAGVLLQHGLALDAFQKYGVTNSPPRYLAMPDSAAGKMPPLLSQTGAFEDMRTLKAKPGLIPYDLNVPFWSDGATKHRWISAPSGIGVPLSIDHDSDWSFPQGTVFVKHFELATDETKPDVKRRLETRLLVRDATGGVYGVTYKWRADNSDAELLVTNLTESIVIKTASGVRTQSYYYPSRQDCLVCHTPLAGGVLGVKAQQLNRDFTYPSGTKANQLRAWNELRMFATKFTEDFIANCGQLALPSDTTQSVEDRARSYLDANCAHCHRPGGTVASFDARYKTPLREQNLIGAPVLIDEGIDRARAIAPNDIWRSIVYLRMSRLDGTKMPPLAHSELDRQGLALVREWIESLPGPRVLAPPEISPRGGDYKKSVTVTMKSAEAGAAIHFTLDGSVPTASDSVYEKPITLNGPNVFRAKTFKPGFTQSITAQEVFIVSD
jgi:uncharacterized repeat protein (TIGR03806 family)